MTVRAAIISSDSTGISRPIVDLLHRFKELSTKKRIFIISALALAAAGALIAVAQASGHDGQPSDNSNGGSTSSSQQPSGNKSTPGDSSSGSKTSDSSATNSNSTSVTVNGKSVDVSQSGTYDKTVDVPGGQVRVSGNSSSSTSGGSATNNSSTNVEVNTN